MKKHKKFKSIQSYEIVLGIVALISFFLGVVPSIVLSDWTWFSRSGALLVIFGVYIVWLDYKGDVNKDLETLLSGFNQYLINHTKDSEADIKKIEAKISEKLNKVRTATEKRFQNIEFFIVAIGTLIWGYGDLINNLLDQSC